MWDFRCTDGRVSPTPPSVVEDIVTLPCILRNAPTATAGDGVSANRVCLAWLGRLAGLLFSERSVQTQRVVA